MAHDHEEDPRTGKKDNPKLREDGKREGVSDSTDKTVDPDVPPTENPE